MTEGTESEGPTPRRALPRAARLSRLPRSPNTTGPGHPDHGDTDRGDTDHGDTGHGDTGHGDTDPAAAGCEPDVPAAPADLALDGPAPAESPVVAGQAALVGPTKAVRNELVDLAKAVVDAEAGETAPHPTASGATLTPLQPAQRQGGRGGAPARLQVLRDLQRPTAAFGGSTVRFQPVEDPSANRAVIVSSFGLLVCFFPLLSLFGLLLGAMSMRRIRASEGSLIGAKTARMGVILGAAGLLIGVGVDVALVISL